MRVSVTPGTHASEAAVNKQLNDKVWEGGLLGRMMMLSTATELVT